MCMAVGKASLKIGTVDVVVGGGRRFLRPAFATGQLNRTVVMTSLVFMLDWVPKPVWKTTSGNSSSIFGDDLVGGLDVEVGNVAATHPVPCWLVPRTS